MAARRKDRRSSPGFGSRLWRPDLLYPCLLVAVVLGLYWNTLGHEFVHDDLTLIQQNRTVTELRWGDILSHRVYRPVRTLTYAFNYWLGGLDPTGYHLFNLLLHALNSLLVYWLFRAVTGRRTLALAGALLFAAHPVQTAAVAYVSGRKDLLAAFFILAGCLSFLSYRDTGRRRYLLLCLACLVVGVLAKELVIVLPALLLLLDLCRPDPSGGPGREPVAVRIFRALSRSRLAYALGFLLAAASLYYALFSESGQPHGGALGREPRGPCRHQLQAFLALFEPGAVPPSLDRGLHGRRLRPLSRVRRRADPAGGAPAGGLHRRGRPGLPVPAPGLPGDGLVPDGVGRRCSRSCPFMSWPPTTFSTSR